MTIFCEWGPAGVALLRETVGLVVIVDVLSFSTAVDIATARGALVHPHRWASGSEGLADAERAAASIGAVPARPRRMAGDGYSLSPASLAAIPPATRLLLPSPNGATLTLACGDTPVMAGCLRNASAVGEAARAFSGGRDIAVVPAGEQWADGSLRPAIEDWLGAGAIIGAIGLPCSAEAAVARDAFTAARADLAHLVRTCASGRELIEAGYGEDVDLALDLDASDGAPLLVDGAYRQ